MFGQGSPSADFRYRTLSPFFRGVMVLGLCCAWMVLDWPGLRGLPGQVPGQELSALSGSSAPVRNPSQASATLSSDSSLTPATDDPGSSPAPKRIRLRIYWGGGSPQAWKGSIHLSQGAFSNPQVLAVSLDAAASAILMGNQVKIQHWSATRYGGIDVDIPDLEGNQLQLSLHNGASSEQTPIESTISVSELLQGTFNRELDGSGNRIMISRVPGDTLPVRFSRPHLIFNPEETFEFGLRINRSDWISQKANCRIRMQPADAAGSTSLMNSGSGNGRPSGSLPLLHPGGRPLHSQSLAFETDASGSAVEQLVQIPVPKEPGIYDLHLELSSPWQQAALKSRSKLERRIQILVLDSTAPATSPPVETWRKLESIDPTAESSSLLPRSLKPHSAESLSNERQQKVMINGRAMLELEVGGWKAIPLNFQHLDKPHLIEVEYLADAPTSVGLSLLERNAADQIPLYGFDSGLHVPSSLIDIYPKADPTPQADRTGTATTPSPRTIKRHQFVVWPRQKQSYLLIANRDNQHSATIGSVEISGGPNRIPIQDPLTAAPATSAGRQFLVFSEEGLFAKNLGGLERTDANGNLYDDWRTFYEGADRLVQHLKAHGYGGAVITVAAEGSTLYPTSVLGNSPRLDTGLLSSVGQDPIRKDVLELLFRMFEREGLTLVPALILNGPLPSLESADLAAAEPDPTIRPVHWTQASGKPSDHFPIYNPLNAQVASAVNSALDELASRYSRFKCFGGIAILCRPNTYTILPGQQWCWDRETLNSFWSEVQGDPNLRGNREPMLEQILGARQQDWLQWRARKMAQWYQTLSRTIQQHQPGASLFLVPVDLYLNEELATVLAPNLHSPPDYAQQMLRLGWDAEQLAELEQVLLLKPRRLAPNQSLASNRLDISLENQLQSDEFFRLAKSVGELFVHRVSWAHFSQLELKAPFDSQRTSLMRLQPLTPAGVWNRQRFLNSLRASDAQFLVDGGALLSLGQEAELQAFRVLFRQLPAQPFVDVRPLEPIRPSQQYAPVIVRQHASPDGNWFYAVNASPWPCKVQLKLNQSSEQPLSVRQLNSVAFQEVPGARTIEFELAPISMTAGVIESGSSIEHYQFELPPNAADRLRKQVHTLQTKLLQSTETQPLDVLSNSYFEVNLQPSLSGWELGQRGTRAISLVTEEPLKGVACLRLNNEEANPVWIRSNAFSLPQTGRLSVSVWLRIPDATQQPPLRISVEGVDEGSNYYRFGSIGSLSADPNSNQLSSEWQRFAVHFDDLPVARLSRIRIGLDLMGAGTVEADRFEVYDRWFDERDAKAINQRLASSGLLLASPLTYESSRILLDSYWLRFLDEYLPDQSASQKAEGDASMGTSSTGPDRESVSKNGKDGDESNSAEDAQADESQAEAAERGLFRRLRRNNRLQR